MLLEPILKEIDLFKDLPPHHLRLLGLACLKKKARKKEILFHESEQGHHLYYLEKGAVQLFKTSPEGREVIIKTVKPGEVFAEIILFEQDSYPVTAVALRESTLVLIPKTKILDLLDDRVFRVKFMASLMKKHRYLTHRILYLSAHDVHERFRLFLKEQYGEINGIFPPLPKKDVAAAIGTTPETLSRILLGLKQKKKLFWKNRELDIRSSFWA
ncbi:MAG: Crp/Fnr family transcriptional regulator [Candidatus Omnitrophota bacterium]